MAHAPSFLIPPSLVSRPFCALIVLSALAVPNSALGASTPKRSRPPPVGTLTQLQGPSGCLVDRSKPSSGKVPDQWEMYDLKADPLERTNLAYKGYKRTAAQERQYRRLRKKLARVERTRLKPLS